MHILTCHQRTLPATTSSIANLFRCWCGAQQARRTGTLILARKKHGPAIAGGMLVRAPRTKTASSSSGLGVRMPALQPSGLHGPPWLPRLRSRHSWPQPACSGKTTELRYCQKIHISRLVGIGARVRTASRVPHDSFCHTWGLREGPCRRQPAGIRARLARL